MIVNPSPVSATPADMLDPAATVAPGSEGLVSVTALAPTNAGVSAGMTDDQKRELLSDVLMFGSILSAVITIIGRRR